MNIAPHTCDDCTTPQRVNDWNCDADRTDARPCMCPCHRRDTIAARITRAIRFHVAIHGGF